MRCLENNEDDADKCDLTCSKSAKPVCSHSKLSHANLSYNEEILQSVGREELQGARNVHVDATNLK